MRKNASMLPKAERARVFGMLDDLEARFSKANGQIVIPGDVANRFQSTIRRTSESAQGFLKNDLSELRKEVLARSIARFRRTMLRPLALTQKKYKAFKTVEPLLAKRRGGRGRPGGWRRARSSVAIGCVQQLQGQRGRVPAG